MQERNKSTRIETLQARAVAAQHTHANPSSSGAGQHSHGSTFVLQGAIATAHTCTAHISACVPLHSVTAGCGFRLNKLYMRSRISAAFEALNSENYDDLIEALGNGPTTGQRNLLEGACARHLQVCNSSALSGGHMGQRMTEEEGTVWWW